MVVFDIDGTLASTEKPGVPLIDMEPIAKTLKIAKIAQRPEVGAIAVVTARSEEYRKETLSWLRKHGVRPKMFLMRALGDLRPDHNVRVDQVKAVMGKFGNNLVLYDDKPANCKAVESKLKVPCILVKE